MGVLTAKRLTIGYGRRSVAGPLDLDVERGSLTVLIGANGCGKSTLLRTLGGETSPLGGELLIEGEPLRDISPRHLARLTSLVSTDRPMTGGLTVWQTVALGRQPHTGFFGRLSTDDRHAVEQALDTIGISAMARRYTATLSDGERQKTMIARALAQQTPIIILDEPTTFLDVASRLEVMALLKQLSADGKSIVMSSHEVGEALSVADSAWLMADGRVTAGAVGELRARGAFDKIFSGRGIAFDAAAGDYRLI